MKQYLFAAIALLTLMPNQALAQSKFFGNIQNSGRTVTYVKQEDTCVRVTWSNGVGNEQDGWGGKWLLQMQTHGQTTAPDSTGAEVLTLAWADVIWEYRERRSSRSPDVEQIGAMFYFPHATDGNPDWVVMWDGADEGKHSELYRDRNTCLRAEWTGEGGS